MNEKAKYPTHTRYDNGALKEQELRDHLRNVSRLAGDRLKPIGLEKLGQAAGLLHDVGKYADEYIRYIRAAERGEKTVRGSVTHSTAGLRYALNTWHQQNPLSFSLEDIATEIMAAAIGNHHGLFDLRGSDYSSGFTRRKDKQPTQDDTSIQRFMTDCVSADGLDKIWKEANNEMSAVFDRIVKMTNGRKAEIHDSEVMFYIGMTVRMLSSALIAADWRDTAEFTGSRDYSRIISMTPALWDECSQSVEQYISKLPNLTDIDHARRDFSDRCKEAAAISSGVHRLSLPTGGGKTLSALRYALNHAKIRNKKRIILVSPYLSILDQNARIVRDAIGDDRLITEHHSNIIRSKMAPDELSVYELLTETWDSPIILTTFVQFLNTLFDSGLQSVQRTSNLIDSVVVLDEVQSIPRRLLTLFNLSINYLTEICGAEVVLCSATQPTLETVQHPSLYTPEEIIPKEVTDKYADTFRRTKYINLGLKRLEDVPEIAEHIIGKYNSLLIVCNTKRQAQNVFSELKHSVEGYVFHLSASMCVAHRRKVISDMTKLLKEGKRVVCVATKVVEAGVDVSFSAGIRFLAGIDNAIQTGGRVNRNGLDDGLAPVYLIEIINEPLKYLPEIEKEKTASRTCLYSSPCTHEKECGESGFMLEGDTFADINIAGYYQALYKDMDVKSQDMPIDKGVSVYSLLSDNIVYNKGERKWFLPMAFGEAGAAFSVYEDNSVSVVVPYGEGKTLISTMLTAHEPTQKLIEETVPYCVSVYRKRYEELVNDGVITELWDGRISVMTEATGYNDWVGLT